MQSTFMRGVRRTGSAHRSSTQTRTSPTHTGCCCLAAEMANAMRPARALAARRPLPLARRALRPAKPCLRTVLARAEDKPSDAEVPADADEQVDGAAEALEPDAVIEEGEEVEGQEGEEEYDSEDLWDSEDEEDLIFDDNLTAEDLAEMGLDELGREISSEAEELSDEEYDSEEDEDEDDIEALGDEAFDEAMEDREFAWAGDEGVSGSEEEDSDSEEEDDDAWEDRVVQARDPPVCASRAPPAPLGNALSRIVAARARSACGRACAGRRRAETAPLACKRASCAQRERRTLSFSRRAAPVILLSETFTTGWSSCWTVYRVQLAGRSLLPCALGGLC